MADTGRTVWADGLWADDFWAAGFWSSSDAPAPTPEQPQVAAGKRRKRHRHFVEIDGQEFDVSGPEEAKELLDKAKALAVQQFESEKNAVVVRPGIKLPQIRTPNKELVPVVQQARQEMKDLFDEVRRDFEIRYLMKKAEDEEEEAIIRLLM